MDVKGKAPYGQQVRARVPNEVARELMREATRTHKSINEVAAVILVWWYEDLKAEEARNAAK